MPALVLWPPVHWPGGALGTACVVSVILGAIPALHLNQRTLGIVLAPHEEDTYRQRLARLARAALRATPLWAPLAFGESLTLVFALEWSTGLQGVGPLTIQALKTGDVPWLMALCLGLGALTALVQIIADAAVQFGTPRARRSEA